MSGATVPVSGPFNALKSLMDKDKKEEDSKGKKESKEPGNSRDGGKGCETDRRIIEGASVGKREPSHEVEPTIVKVTLGPSLPKNLLLLAQPQSKL